MSARAEKKTAPLAPSGEPLLVRVLPWLLLALGAFFRLYNLGYPALRGDTLHFWSICNTNITGWQIVTRWTELGVGQLPLPLALTKFVIDVFHLPVTHFTLRLVNALFGILLVPVAYASGRRLGGFWCGVIAGLFTALNPFHIQMSQEAYFYASLMLGGGLCFLAYLQVVQAVDAGRAVPRSYYAVSAAGFLLIAYSQVTGWLFLALFCALMLWLLWRRWRATGRFGYDFIYSVALWGVIGAPLLFVSWGLPHNLSKLSSPAQDRAVALSGLAVAGGDPWSMIVRTVTSFGWGDTPVRAGFTLLVLALGVYAIVAFWRTSRAVRWLPALFVVNLVLFFLTRGMTDAMYESRYVGGLLPVYLGLLALGATQAAALPFLRDRLSPRWSWLPAGAVVLVGAGLWLQPAYAVTQLTGQPAPYRDMVAFADSHFPRGTPVLVDRWFEPWNELRPYPSTNDIVFTFTVPNEPIETFLRAQWRVTAQQFFARHPDAAYLQIARTYWQMPTVGPWDWPGQYFAHHVAISNEAGLLLRNLGLAARGDYYPADTNRVVVDYYYNTRADVMQHMQAAGVRLFTWYGAGWKFEKSGPMGLFRVQTSDFRDWRVLDETASLEAINLTTNAAPVFLTVRAAAVGGSKTVQLAGDVKHSFQAGKMADWRIGPLVLQPGINILTLSDPLWRLGQSPLLVDGISVEDAPPGTDLSSALRPSPAR